MFVKIYVISLWFGAYSLKLIKFQNQYKKRFLEASLFMKFIQCMTYISLIIYKTQKINTKESFVDNLIYFHCEKSSTLSKKKSIPRNIFYGQS